MYWLFIDYYDTVTPSENILNLLFWQLSCAVPFFDKSLNMDQRLEMLH